MDEMNNWRPKYGQANVGYDMEAARQYPQIDERTARLGLGGLVGAGLGAVVPGGWMAIPAGTLTSMAGRGYLSGALAAHGAGAAYGAKRVPELISEQFRDAEGQPGGFYGRKPVGLAR